MDNLPGAANPGIGAPSTKNSDRSGSDKRQRLFNSGLDSGNVGISLSLPAVIGTAIVGDSSGVAVLLGRLSGQLMVPFSSAASDCCSAVPP